MALSAKEKVTPKSVMRRYMFSILGFSMGYAGALIGVTIAIRNWTDAPLIWIMLLAAIPGVCLGGMLWSFWRFLNDVDEVARYFLVQSMIVGLFGILALSGIWGLVEMLSDDVPRLPIFWIFPVFFVIYGLAAGFGPGRDMGCK